MIATHQVICPDCGYGVDDPAEHLDIDCHAMTALQIHEALRGPGWVISTGTLAWAAGTLGLVLGMELGALLWQLFLTFGM